MSDITTFDLAGPLPSGTTVLEASAGTGKTYTIAGLVTRWVAETELRLPHLLVVTFTRAATAELRDRVRRRLVAAADHLEAIEAGERPATDDAVLELLARAGRDEIATRRRRLVRALSDVDAATISTIHGFCQHVLDGLGIASDLDRDAELVESQADLIEEVVDDLLVETYLDAGERPRVSRSELVSIAYAVVANPTTALAPRRPEPGSEAALRLHLAQRIRRDVEQRARRRRQLSYDDLLTQLDATLRDPDRGGAACAALRQRYRVTLIDEFQDTDPVQWSIVSTAFADAPDAEADRALVLIGDPKQAIYAFRGADVYAYLDASRKAAVRHTLGTSWRADAGLLRAFDALMDGATFGDVGIPYRQVECAPGHDSPRLVDPPSSAALRLRVLPRHDRLTVQKNGKIVADEARDVVARDLAADVVRLLGSRPTLVQRDRRGAVTGERPLVPGDLAVLVRRNNEATLIQEALQDVDVPSVVSGVDSVFQTTAATEWRRLLDALERPASSTRVRALALTAWVGWTGDEVAAATEQRWDRLHDDVHTWATLLRDHGVATTLRTVMLQRGVQRRLLAQRGGERLLADLEHVGELLHAAAVGEHLGITALSGWLRERVEDAADESQDDRLRRLETDDDAVQILTVHRSKGLEFPIVYCPYLWSSSGGVRGAPVFHDGDRTRLIDVGGSGHDEFDEHKQRAEDEARGEQLRLVYVAMTRARHQVVAWWAPAGVPEWSGLGRLLLCRDEDGRADPARPAPLPDDDEARAAVEAIAARGGGTVALEVVPAEPAADPWVPDAVDRVELDRARFDRALDVAWRRTSYSALTRFDDPTPRVGSEADEPTKDDEALTTEAVETVTGARRADDPLTGVELPLGEMPGGTHVGTFVHRVLEHTDFDVDDLDAELDRRIHDELERRRLDLDPAVLRTGLEAAIETPLGPRVGGLRLADVTRSHRRDEVDFELPLDRDPAGRTATIEDIAGLLREHLPADDPLAGYAEQLPHALRHRDLRGYLGGSIDLILRRTADGGRPVFHVIDHKTNRLAWGETLTAWHYRPAALADAMIHGHYPLQALLYAVALHRLLRWRLPGYDPAVNLGSATYLFVRGMVGADTPVVDGHPCGVFTWDLPPELVVATSDLLHGVRP